MVEGRLIERAGEHARNLAHALLPRDLFHARDGQVGARLLGDDVVLVCERGDLRQMGDDDDLRMSWAILRATAEPVAPPMPWSTSSNTIVRSCSAAVSVPW